jgi:hypothetical protein
MLKLINVSDPGNFLLAVVAWLAVFSSSWFAVHAFLKVRRQYGKSDLVDTYSTKVSRRTIMSALVLSLLVPTLIGAAIVGPYRDGVMHLVPAGSQDIVIGIQDSRGMGTVDYPSLSGGDKLQFFNETGSDLDAARYMVEKGIMPAMVGNQIALVVYQGQAMPLVDLTDQQDIIKATLERELKIGLAPIGTSEVNGKVSSIAAFLQVALAEFDRFGAQGSNKVIVIFSKGDDVSDPEFLAQEEEQVHARQIKVVIVGVGGAPALIPIYGGDDQQFLGYYQFNDRTFAMSGIDEGNLRKLAQDLGGTFVLLDPDHLATIDWVATLTSWRMEVGMELLFAWPAMAAYVLLVVTGTGGYLRKVWLFLFRRSTKGRVT